MVTQISCARDHKVIRSSTFGQAEGTSKVPRGFLTVAGDSERKSVGTESDGRLAFFDSHSCLVERIARVP